MDKIYDTLIIGTGPAGLCASIYGERAMLNVLALEENYVSGGQMATTYEVDNYPGMPGSIRDGSGNGYAGTCGENGGSRSTGKGSFH